MAGGRGAGCECVCECVCSSLGALLRHWHGTFLELPLSQHLGSHVLPGFVELYGDETALSRVLGGKLCLWGDAAQVDSGDIFITAAPYMHGAAEAWWSPQHKTSGVSPDSAKQRLHFHRCRMTARGFPGHPIYFFGAPACPVPYDVKWLPTWENATEEYKPRGLDGCRLK